MGSMTAVVSSQVVFYETRKLQSKEPRSESTTLLDARHGRYSNQ